MNYEESWKNYKGSPAWYRLKDKALARAGYRCESDIPELIGQFERECRCENTEDLEMHHITYPEYPYELNDKLENVRIYCREHHEYSHWEELDRAAYVDEAYT